MNCFALAFALSLSVPVTALAADEYLTKKPDAWTPEEAQTVLTKSPWAIDSPVLPHVLRAPDDAADKPTSTMLRVPVTVGWFSSGIYRNALAKQFEGMSADQLEEMTRPDDRFYVIELVTADTLSVFDSVAEEDLAKATSLEVDGQKLPLSFVVLPGALKAPRARFFFDRGTGIPAKAKAAVFKTKARDAAIEAKFKLEKMKWQGTRDLDGQIGELTASEKRRREVQSAVLGTESAEFHRAVTDVRLERMKDKDRPYAAYVFYEASRESKDADATARKLGMVQRVGNWSLANGNSIQAVVFLNPKTNKAVDYVIGPDAEKIARLAPESALKTFKEKLTPADKKPEAPREVKPKGKPKG